MDTRFCEHDWQPVPGWGARYRCTKCQAYGHKANITNQIVKIPMIGIVPYVCQVPGCNQMAQVSSSKGKRRCFKHWKK